MRIIVPTTAGMINLANNAVDTIRAVGRDAELHILTTERDEINERYVEYATDPFHLVVVKKIELVISILEQGDAVLLVDADIGFRRDPIPYLEKINADVVIQSDSLRVDRTNTTYCTGFFLARPSPAVITLFYACLQRMKAARQGDQKSFNESVQQTSDIKIHRLPDLHFPNGSIWMNHRPKQAYIVHANFVVGLEDKYRMLQGAGLYGGGKPGVYRTLYRLFNETAHDAAHLVAACREKAAYLAREIQARTIPRIQRFKEQSRSREQHRTIGCAEVFGVHADGWMSRRAVIVVDPQECSHEIVLKIRSLAPEPAFPIILTVQNENGAKQALMKISEPGEFEIVVEFPNAPHSGAAWLISDTCFSPREHDDTHDDQRELSVMLTDVMPAKLKMGAETRSGASS